MSILGNRILGGAGQQPYLVGRSLRFRSSATAYLNRTPSVTGSRQKFTWSAWVKRGILTTGTYYQLFGAGPGAGGNEGIFFDTTAGGLYLTNDGPSTAIITSAVFRDPSAWYHIVCAVDTTQATAANRQIFYINGVQQTSYTGSYCAQNTNFTYINVSGVQHRMGAHTNSGYYFDGYMAEINYVDGQQLTPSSFGFYDNNGVWQPRKYGGTYGTNGFYLPFSSGFNTTQTYAGSFNGSNQFINVASSASLAPGTGDFTFEANVNFNSTPSASAYAGIFENQIATTSAVSDKFFVSLFNSAGTLRLLLGQHNTSNTAYVNWTPALGTWYHIALVRQSGTTLIFINGVQQSVTNSTIFNGTNFSQNGASVGAVSTPFYFNGYISNARYVVGSAVYTTGFTPPSANLTAVSGTQLLTLQNSTLIDNSSAARAITNNNGVSLSSQYPFQYTVSSISADASGNGNNWTANNINSTILGTTYDSMVDSPTVSASASNYAVWNAVFTENSLPNATMSNGNLKATAPTTSSVSSVGTIGASTGKWYWENKVDGLPSVGTLYLGLAQTSPYASTYIRAYRHDTGEYFNGSTWAAYGATYTTGDVIGIALDLDNQTLTFYKNGVSQGQKTSIGLTGITVFPFAYLNYSTASVSSNFGQQPFTYTPPSGFNALNTYNLPQPTIMNGARVMAATTYTGNGGTQTISNGSSNTTGVVFQPDFIWIKNRAAAVNHQLQNSNVGWQYGLNSNNTNAEYTDANAITGATSSGWSMNNNYNSHNQSGVSYIGWQWNAGSGVTSTNTNGSISSLVSVNPTAGFSIASYTGTGAVATVGHGLGVAPNMIIWKNRSSVENWVVYHSSLGATGNVYLNLTNGFSTDSTTQNNTAPTSSVFTVATSGAVNGSTRNIIAYCWSAVAGYSAFGSYTGNLSTDGPFIYTGFRPRWVLIKRTDAASGNGWILLDTSRTTINVEGERLFPNLSNAGSNDTQADFLSNGFKLRGVDTDSNANGGTFIYAAFAENPFKISRAR